MNGFNGLPRTRPWFCYPANLVLFFFIFASGLLSGAGKMRLAGMVLAGTFVWMQCMTKMRLRKSEWTHGLTSYVLYVLWVFGTGIIVARYPELFFSNFKTLIQTAILIISVYGIAVKQKTFMPLFWGVLILALIHAGAILLGVQAIRGDITGAVEIGVDLGETEQARGLSKNQNAAGGIMWLGIWAACTLWNCRGFLPNILHKIFLLVCMGVFGYVSTKIGSRQTILNIAIVICAWSMGIMPRLVRSSALKFVIRVAVVIMLIVGGGFAINYMLNETVLGVRLMRQFDRGGGSMIEGGKEDVRYEIYSQGFKMLAEHPLAGVGFGHYVVYCRTGHFSHSDYMEPLACNGIIGFILYHGYFFSVLMTILWVRKRWNKQDMDTRYLIDMLLLYCCVRIFGGLFTPYWYHMNLVTVLAYVAAIATRLKNEVKYSRLRMYYR